MKEETIISPDDVLGQAIRKAMENRDNEIKALKKWEKRQAKKWRFYRDGMAITKIKTKWYNKDIYAITCPECRHKFRHKKKEFNVENKNEIIYCPGYACGNRLVINFKLNEVYAVHKRLIS
jgi:hypothetical protein